MGKQTGDIFLLHDAVQSCEINEPDMNSNSVLDTNSTNIKLKRQTIRVAQSCYETNLKCGQILKTHVRTGEAALNLYRTFFFRFSFKASSASKNVNSHTNNCPNRSPLGHPQCIEQLNLPHILQLVSYIPIIRV